MNDKVFSVIPQYHHANKEEKEIAKAVMKMLDGLSVNSARRIITLVNDDLDNCGHVNADTIEKFENKLAVERERYFNELAVECDGRKK